MVVESSFYLCLVLQGAKSITTFEILPQPPPSRGRDNPWPTYPRVFKVDYGHEEVKLKFGRDPREYNTLTKASSVIGLEYCIVDLTVLVSFLFCNIFTEKVVVSSINIGI